ncbi:YjbF family lipoprotein [Vibrio maritimus]|uniref:YjbF family lipoprotein n=1 Tax=Vibrio maritimus TaxID=990268 RepID=UPI0037370463
MKFKSTLLACSVLILAGCSQRFQDVNATLSEAFLGADDIVMTAEQIESLPYASAYARINDGAQIFVVLAFAEKNPATGEMQYKWMSSDRAMFIFESGRLVKTIGLYGDNLQGATHTQLTDSSWTTQYDWMPDYRYGYKGTVTRTQDAKEAIETPLNRYQTQKYTERVHFDAIDQAFTNQYWQSQSSGRMVKSIEYLGPQMTKIEFTVLKQPSM